MPPDYGFIAAVPARPILVAKDRGVRRTALTIGLNEVSAERDFRSEHRKKIRRAGLNMNLLGPPFLLSHDGVARSDGNGGEVFEDRS